MAQKLCPISLVPFLDSNGDPYVGAQLFTYVAGSSTKQTTTKDLAGASNHANPIILNASGMPGDGAGAAQAIWQPEGVSLKLVLAPSTDTDPPVAAIRTYDNISGINDTTVSVDEWVAGPAPTFVDATNFTLVGDQTSTFHVGRRVKMSVTAGTIYGTITVSAYTSLTTITVAVDSGSIDSGLSAVWYGLLSETNHAIPFGAMFTAIGDMIYGSAVSIASRLGIGSAASVLMTDGSTPSWANQGNPGQTYVVNPAQTAVTGHAYKDWIGGLIPSIGTDTAHDVDITAGEASDSGNTTMLVGGAMTKQIDATWASGSAAGGMATVTAQTGTFVSSGTAITGTGTAFDTEFSVGDVLYSSTETEGRRITVITDATNATVESAYTSPVAGDAAQKNGLAPNTTYYIHAIQLTASPFSIDYYFDTSVTAANIISTYTAYRQIGELATDASSNITSGSVKRAGIPRQITVPADIAGSAGVWTQSSSADFSSDANVELDLTGNNQHRITFSRIKPAADNSEMIAEISEDNGSSWKTGATDYEYQLTEITATTETHTNSTGAANIPLTAANVMGTTSSPAGWSGEIRIFKPADGLAWIHWRLTGQIFSTLINYEYQGIGLYNGTGNEVTNIRFDIGTFASGNYIHEVMD